MDPDTDTCSFVMDKNDHNAYKSSVVGYEETVKSNIAEHMQNVSNYGIPNAETIAAIQEVAELEKDPNKKVYNSFEEILAELDTNGSFWFLKLFFAS